jgi:hypothetical protein
LPDGNALENLLHIISVKNKLFNENKSEFIKTAAQGIEKSLAYTP